jgi:hypothetical protein
VLTNDAKDHIADAFAIAKLQAQCDGAFPEPLLRHWFEAAWQHCAEMVGFVYPAQEVREPISLRLDGSFTISHRPTGPVRIFAGYTLLMTLPPSLERTWCDPSLCCHCNLFAQYMIGEDTCNISPSFVQAVARLFTYMVENRGDVEMDREILAKCGALTFLSGGLTYAL